MSQNIMVFELSLFGILLSISDKKGRIFMNYFKDNLTQNHPFFIHHENIADSKNHNKIHKHRDIEILLVSKGSAHIVLDYNLYKLVEGDIVFINSDIAHSLLIEDENETEIFYLQFLPELVYDYGNDFFDMMYFSWLVTYKDSKYMKFNTKENTMPAEYIHKAYDIYKEKKPGYETALVSRILLICVWFFECQNKLFFSSHKRISYLATTIIRKIFNYVENNYSAVSVAEITEKLSLSSNDLKVFRNSLGFSLRRYIQNYRISLAKYLLSSTDMSITEILYNIGYNNSSYFSKLFANHTGHTPSQFRKKHRISMYLEICKTSEIETFQPLKADIDKEIVSDSKSPWYSAVFSSAYYEKYYNTPYEKNNEENEFYEIIYNDIDRCIIEFDDKAYTLTPGDVIIISPHEQHKLLTQSEENHLLRIQFYSDIFNIGSYTPDFIEMLDLYTKKDYRLFSLLSEKEPEIVQSFSAIYGEHDKFNPSSEVIVRANIMNIISWILSKQHESCPDLEPQKETKYTAVLKEIINYINNHYTENLSLEEIAHKFFINYKYLSKKLKEITRQNFNSYVSTKRIIKARFLLMATDYSINRISQILGFCSHSRFTESFRKQSGVTPREFRKRFKANRRLNKN